MVMMVLQMPTENMDHQILRARRARGLTGARGGGTGVNWRSKGDFVLGVTDGRTLRQDQRVDNMSEGLCDRK